MPAFQSYDLLSYLRTDKVQACVGDQIEESLLMVPTFQQLAVLSDSAIAMANFEYRQDANNSLILCQRDGEEVEATFSFSGVLTHKSVMPYMTHREMNDVGPWARVGEQHVVLVAPGLEHLKNVKAAIHNLHVMAGLRSERPVTPLTDLIVDGEESLCLSTPIGTFPAHAVATDVPLVLTQQQDPRGIVAAFIHQRGLMVLEDNQVDVYLAAHGPKAGQYELLGGSCGALLRPGQVVRVEVGFKIVPAGNRAFLRMELKSVVIINDDIVATMAFAVGRSDKVKRTISVSSSGPSGVTVPVQPRVKRVDRNGAKKANNARVLGELPFAQ